MERLPALARERRGPRKRINPQVRLRAPARRRLSGPFLNSAQRLWALPLFSPMPRSDNLHGFYNLCWQPACILVRTRELNEKRGWIGLSSALGFSSVEDVDA